MFANNRRPFNDPYFLLSIGGLCLMVFPLAFVFFLNNVAEAGRLMEASQYEYVRPILSFISRSQLIMTGMIAVAAIGVGIVAVAWYLMLRRYYRNSRQTSPPRNR